HRRTRGALVVAEVALALVLLVSSGLLLRSLGRLFAVDAGFGPGGLLTMQLSPTGPRYSAPGVANRFYAQALEAVKAVPGVSEAAITSQLPLSGDRDEYGVAFEGITGGFSTYRYGVSPGYIEAMRIPLRRGRSLAQTDAATAPLVVLIAE